MFSNVQVGHVNRADAAAGDVADLDCQDEDGRTLISVEVKDRQLTVREVEDALRVARDRGVAEIIYVIRGGVRPEDASSYEEVKARQFNAGHNVYEIEFQSLMRACLILFGESGRSSFIEAVGSRIDAYGNLADRQDWQAELQRI